MSCDIDAIKDRLDAARFAAHAGMSLSEEAAAWMALRDNAANDIACLLEWVEVLRDQRDSERDRAMTARHELHMARQTVLSVRTAYDKVEARLDAVRTFAADWEAVQAHNREAFSRGRIGYMKDAPTLDRLQAILNGGAA